MEEKLIELLKQKQKLMDKPTCILIDRMKLRKLRRK